MAKSKGWNWRNAPTVAAITGSDGFHRRRAVRRAIRGAVAAGRRVEYADGGDPEAISETLSSAVLFPEPVLLVVTDVGEVDPFEIGAHADGGDNAVTILLVHDGEPKGKVADLVGFVPERYHFSYSEPPDYKKPEVASGFVQAEAKRWGLGISADLADALVSRVGSDLGVLSYEMLKVEALLKSRGEGPEVTPEHVASTMSLGGDVDIGAVVDAVGRASVAKTLKAMHAVRENSPHDPTLRVIGWVGRRATTWLHAATLIRQGASVEEGASRTGTRPYVYQSFIVPVAKRWGASHLMSLLRRLASAEASVKAGHTFPWTQLECGLVVACRSVGGGR